MSTPGHVKLTETQVSAVKRVKQAEKDFSDMLRAELPEGADPRCIATANTHIQTARFFAVAAITEFGKYKTDPEPVVDEKGASA